MKRFPTNPFIIVFLSVFLFAGNVLAEVDDLSVINSLNAGTDNTPSIVLSYLRDKTDLPEEKLVYITWNLAVELSQILACSNLSAILYRTDMTTDEDKKKKRLKISALSDRIKSLIADSQADFKLLESLTPPDEISLSLVKPYKYFIYQFQAFEDLAQSRYPKEALLDRSYDTIRSIYLALILDSWSNDDNLHARINKEKTTFRVSIDSMRKDFDLTDSNGVSVSSYAGLVSGYFERMKSARWDNL